MKVIQIKAIGIKNDLTQFNQEKKILWSVGQNIRIFGPYLQIKITRGSFIYYVTTFLGFLDPPPPLRQHVFSTKNKQKLAFSDPPPPLQVLT